MFRKNCLTIPAVNDATKFGKVAVLFGGNSAERAISLEGGQAVLNALRNRQVEAYGIDVGRSTLQQLTQNHYDRIFLMLHGRGGEDGTVQGALETLGLAYTGSGVSGSALSMDKARTKYLWQATGIPTPRFQVAKSETEILAAAKELGFPLIVKPVHEGSSIGASKITSTKELSEAWCLASSYDSFVLVERWVDGVEYTAAILGQTVFPLIRLETPRTFYDFEAKYSDSAGTQYHCPCGLGSYQEKLLGDMALRAFEVLGACGWGRVDFICDASGEPWFIEVNTIPGMTGHSLVPMAAHAAGISFDDLVWRILETSF